MTSPHLFVLVGASGSGKDLLIRAIDTMGLRYVDIVPKHTTRARRDDDGDEMICFDDANYDLESCDIQYENYSDQYGIQSERIWQGLEANRFQVIVVSPINAIKKLQKIFGNLMILVYVHSQVSAEEYRQEAIQYGEISYVEKRTDEYLLAFDVYLRYFLAFNHVLIYTGLDEDLYDQLFRLFRAYDRGDLAYVGARSVASSKIWDEEETNRVLGILDEE
jgi:guanylate kinase